MIQLYGILDPESLLKHGKKVGFLKDPNTIQKKKN